MASFTITTTTAQDAKITELLQPAVDAENARRAAADPPEPSITLIQYAKERLEDVIRSWVRSHAEERKATLNETWTALSDDQRDRILNIVAE